MTNQRLLTALTEALEWDKTLKEQLDEARSQTSLENTDRSNSKGLSRNKWWRERMNKGVPWNLMYGLPLSNLQLVAEMWRLKQGVGAPRKVGGVGQETQHPPPLPLLLQQIL